MNRRDFLKRLGGAAAAITLSPLLDFAPIEAAPSVALLDDEFVAYMTWTMRLYVDNPRCCGVITNIAEG